MSLAAAATDTGSRVCFLRPTILPPASRSIVERSHTLAFACETASRDPERKGSTARTLSCERRTLSGGGHRGDKLVAGAGCDHNDRGDCDEHSDAGAKLHEITLEWGAVDARVSDCGSRVPEAQGASRHCWTGASGVTRQISPSSVATYRSASGPITSER